MSVGCKSKKSLLEFLYDSQPPLTPLLSFRFDSLSLQNCVQYNNDFYLEKKFVVVYTTL